MSYNKQDIKNITIKDVANAANVSIATVSRILNGKDKVSSKLTERVQAIVKEMNYQPNGIARALKVSETRSIGLIIPDIENPFFPALVRGVEDAAKEQGYAVILCNTDGKPSEEERYLQFLLSKQVDGILFAGNLNYEKNKSWLSVLSVPLVLLDRRIIGAPFSTVLVNNTMGGSMAVDHLIKQGRRHIAVIAGRSQSPTSMERVKGALDQLVACGHSLESQLLLDGYFTFEGGYKATELLIKSGQCFDAVFAANDMMAIGVVECLLKYGRHVPDDVAVVGFDDISMAGWYKPSLTTIRQPVYDIGSCAATILVEKIAGLLENYYEKIFTPELIVRQSSGKKEE